MYLIVSWYSDGSGTPELCFCPGTKELAEKLVELSGSMLLISVYEINGSAEYCLLAGKKLDK